MYVDIIRHSENYTGVSSPAHPTKPPQEERRMFEEMRKKQRKTILVPKLHSLTFLFFSGKLCIERHSRYTLYIHLLKCNMKLYNLLCELESKTTLKLKRIFFICHTMLIKFIITGYSVNFLS